MLKVPVKLMNAYLFICVHVYKNGLLEKSVYFWPKNK